MPLALRHAGTLHCAGRGAGRRNRRSARRRYPPANLDARTPAQGIYRGRSRIPALSRRTRNVTGGELIYLVWNDLVGLSRTRGVPVAEYEHRKAHGLGWALAGQATAPFEGVAENPWGPMDEVRQTPDDETRRRVVLRPEHPSLHLVFCDSLNPDGSPWECRTRSFGARCRGPSARPGAFRRRRTNMFRGIPAPPRARRTPCGGAPRNGTARHDGSPRPQAAAREARRGGLSRRRHGRRHAGGPLLSR